MSITDLLAGRGKPAELFALQKQGALPHPQSWPGRSAPLTHTLNDIGTDDLPQISARQSRRRRR